MDEKLETPGETPFPVGIDMRDTAKGHVRAFEEVGASNQRYVVSSGTFTHQHWVDIVRKHFPSLKDRLPTERVEERAALGIDHSKAIRDLKFAPRPLEETVVDTVHRFLEIEMVK